MNAVYVSSSSDYERILSFYHSIGSPIDGAPNAVIKAQDSFVITNKHSNYHLYINNNPQEQSNIRERKRGGCRWVS